MDKKEEFVDALKGTSAHRLRQLEKEILDTFDPETAEDKSSPFSVKIREADEIIIQAFAQYGLHPFPPVDSILRMRFRTDISKWAKIVSFLEAKKNS